MHVVKFNISKKYLYCHTQENKLDILQLCANHQIYFLYSA